MGTKVEVLWTKEDLEGTGLEPGWYEGEVQLYNDDEDQIHILYKHEVASTKCRRLYCISATIALADGIIRLRR